MPIAVNNNSYNAGLLWLAATTPRNIKDVKLYKACETCRYRKVKCRPASDDGPCTFCQKHSTECYFEPISRAHRARGKSSARIETTVKKQRLRKASRNVSCNGKNQIELDNHAPIHTDKRTTSMPEAGVLKMNQTSYLGEGVAVFTPMVRQALWPSHDPKAVSVPGPMIWASEQQKLQIPTCAESQGQNVSMCPTPPTTPLMPFGSDEEISSNSELSDWLPEDQGLTDNDQSEEPSQSRSGLFSHMSRLSSQPPSSCYTSDFSQPVNVSLPNSPQSRVLRLSQRSDLVALINEFPSNLFADTLMQEIGNQWLPSSSVGLQSIANRSWSALPTPYINIVTSPGTIHEEEHHATIGHLKVPVVVNAPIPK